MKTIFKYSKFLILTFLLTIFSCSSDDDSNSGGINTTDFTVNFDENPTDGESIGTVQAASEQTLSFGIVSQEPAGAISIVSDTGELKVANPVLFDFETHPVITAVVSVITSGTSKNINVTINLNDLDDIEHWLSDSKEDYQNASDGDWIEISKKEYNSLANNLNKVSKVVTSDANYNRTPINGTSSSEATLANAINSSMVKDSYVFAIKYHAVSVDNSNNTKIKLSTTSVTEGYSDLGYALPKHSGINEDLYFVLKGNDTQANDTGYLAFYKPSGSEIGYVNLTGNDKYVYKNGDRKNLDQSYGGRLLYQGLSTTQKQW